jgi:hypothetical protein
MDKIFGSVELDLEIKDINAVNDVNVSDYEWEIQSMYVVIDGENERKIWKRAEKMKDMWNGFVRRIFS